MPECSQRLASSAASQQSNEVLQRAKAAVSEEVAIGARRTEEELTRFLETQKALQNASKASTEYKNLYVRSSRRTGAKPALGKAEINRVAKDVVNKAHSAKPRR